MRWAYLTDDLPGTGGVLRTTPEDFRVDEIPAYRPSGEGEHVFVHVEKRGIPTFEAIRRIAQALDLHERFVAHAGLKDARAVTTQWLSLRDVDEDRVRALDVPGLRVLAVARHGNRLRIGHLRGNRFAIVVRDACPDAAARAATILDVLVRRGVPNYFGEQRFGARLYAHRFGEAMLRRDYDAFVRAFLGGGGRREKDARVREARRLFDEGRLAEAHEAMPANHRAERKALHALLHFGDPVRACAAVPRRYRQMYVSSFQSWLFNRLLDERLRDPPPGGAFDRLVEGDLAYLHRNGRVFPVEDVAREQPRCIAFEVSPSGPIFGTRTSLAQGEAGAREARVLAETGLDPEAFDLGRGLLFKGQRRAIRIPLREVVLAPAGDRSYRVEFALPSGCFATAVMRELTKVAPDGDPA